MSLVCSLNTLKTVGFIRCSTNDKKIMESINVVVDDQKITSTKIRKDDVETKVPHCAPGDSVSVIIQLHT